MESQWKPSPVEISLRYCGTALLKLHRPRMDGHRREWVYNAGQSGANTLSTADARSLG